MTAHSHDRRLLCVIGSTPSYALGTIDPIAELAAMARGAGVGVPVGSQIL